MKKYASAAAFRAALEDHLKKEATGLLLARGRKAVVFDRFLARLAGDTGLRWVAKGGLALQLRLGPAARTTRDVDLDSPAKPDRLVEALQAAAARDAGDPFELEVERVAAAEAGEPEGGGVRFRIRATLAGRLFEEVFVDVGSRDPLPTKPERLVGPPLLRFAGIEPAVVPAAPLEQHLAEKLHAYSRTYAGGRRSSRTKDLVDVALIARMRAFRLGELRAAVVRTFEVRATHPIPATLLPPPAEWSVPYRKLAIETGLPPTLGSGFEVATRLLTPALVDGPDARWSPAKLRWGPGRR